MKETTIEVVLADHQKIARIGVREVLAQTADIEIVAETGSGEEALGLARRKRPDVLVAEAALPDLSGIQIALRLAGKIPVRVLILSAYREERYVRSLLENEVAGYLLKRDAPERIVEAIRRVAHGETGWMSPHVARKALKLERQNDATPLLDERGITPRDERCCG